MFLSLLLLSLVTFVTSTIPNTVQAWTFVEQHNNYRQTVDPPAIYMPALTWSSNLATSSNNWDI